MWTDAMLVLASIHISCPINQAPHLLKQINTIRTGASCNPNSQGWIDHDKQFRLRKAFDPSISWSALDSEFMAYLHGPNIHKLTLPSRCYDYNFKGFCARQSCFYAHTFLSCFRSHPQVYNVYCPRHNKEAYTYTSAPSNSPFRVLSSLRFRNHVPTNQQFNSIRPLSVQRNFGPRQRKQIGTRTYSNSFRQLQHYIRHYPNHQDKHIYFKAFPMASG